MTDSRFKVVGLVVVLVVAASVVGAQNLIDVKLPPGAVIAFDLDECPDGWDEFVVAEGRFLRGMTDSEKHGQRGGTAQHLHNASTETSGAVRGVDNDDDHTVSNWDHYHAVKVEEQEHLPEYVAVLFCRLRE